MDSDPLRIVTYPHPTLRYESKPVLRVDARLRKIIDQMFDLMYEARGVGLAANQVDLPLRLFVANPAGERGDGEELVVINPVLDQFKGTTHGEEGCLSLPGLYAPVARAKSLKLLGYDLKGQAINREVDGYLARIIQHEYDHLNGVLFIDRLSEEQLRDLAHGLEELQIDFESKSRTGTIPSASAIASRRAEWEQAYA
jgi:peptide deformylase